MQSLPTTYSFYFFFPSKADILGVDLEENLKLTLNWFSILELEPTLLNTDAGLEG